MLTQDVTIAPRRHTVAWEYRLVSCVDSVRQARRHARYALEPYADEETLFDLELVVSELVTNAVTYGPKGLITLRLVAGADGSISGEVLDQGHGGVEMREREIDTVGGLGLPIVDALASEWGVVPCGSHVWFRFDRR